MTSSPRKNTLRPIHAALALIVLLSGCATTQETHLSDLTVAHAIECNGVFGSWSSCQSMASTVCADNGYKLIATDQAEPLESDNSIVEIGSYHKRRMLVQCTARESRMASLK